MNAITKEIQQQMNPSEALDRLKEGNERFFKGARGEVDLRSQRKETSSGQFPFAAVLGCVDSRAAAEFVFDLGIGDIFNVRIAGNIVNEDILGSLEFACNISGAKLILVLGHSSCGAVTSACKNVELGNITPMLSKIKPAVLAIQDPLNQVDKVAEQNVRVSIEHIRERSQILAEMERKGEIMIQGAMYDVKSGRVDFLDQ
jgi:carbonic anhydrase